MTNRIHMLRASAVLLTIHLMGCAAADAEAEQAETATGEVRAATDAEVDAVVNSGADDAVVDGPDATSDDLGALDDGGPTADPDPTAVYYAPEHVLDVAITMDDEDWDLLRRQTRTMYDILGGDCLAAPVESAFTWFSATVTVDGETISNAGIRKKGFLGSLSATKPSLKVRFDKHVDGQLLGGVLKRMTLNNVRQDASKLNTCMSYAAFAAAGVPTPRCNFARVSINGVDFGLYVHVESLKKAFLTRSFTSPEGNLYEGAISDFRAEWQGTFQKKTNEKEDDWSDIEAAVAAIEDDSPAGLEALGEVFDLDAYLTFWAIEVLVGHWDGYAGNLNNFWFYREPGERFVMIPWGPDSSFKPVDNPFEDIDYPASVMANGALANRLYADPEWRQAFSDRLVSLLDTVWDEEAMLAEVDRMAAIVQAHALAEVTDVAAQDTERVRAHITNQREAVMATLGVDWPWPLRPSEICWGTTGTVHATFSTTWGTNESESPPSEGQAEFLDYVEHGEPVALESSGAIAGIENKGQNVGQAMVGLISTMSNGMLDAIVVYTAPDNVVPGASLSVDGGGTQGLHVRAEWPYLSFEIVGWLVDGTLTLDEADTQPGGVISGSIQGSFTGPQGQQ
ncbi:MAG: CotH kinase family protein [Myxococcota bacterium]